PRGVSSAGDRCGSGPLRDRSRFHPPPALAERQRVWEARGCLLALGLMCTAPRVADVVRDLPKDDERLLMLARWTRVPRPWRTAHLWWRATAASPATPALRQHAARPKV